MTPLQLELTKLIGKKDLSFGCIVYVKVDGFDSPKRGLVIELFSNEKYRILLEEKYIRQTDFNDYDITVIGNPATLSDLHMWMNNKNIRFCQDKTNIIYSGSKNFPYDSSKDLLDQDESVLKQLIDFIKSNQ